MSLNGPAPQQVTVDVATVDGEATSHGNVTPTSLGQDFVARNETLTFAAGEQTKTFSVVTLDDTIHEKNETFTAELSTPRQTLNRYNSSDGGRPSPAWPTTPPLEPSTTTKHNWSPASAGPTR